MNHEIRTLNDTGRNHDRDLLFTTFYCGVRGGQMIKIAQGVGCSPAEGPEPGYIELTRDNAAAVIVILQDWIRGASNG